MYSLFVTLYVLNLREITSLNMFLKYYKHKFGQLFFRPYFSLVFL